MVSLTNASGGGTYVHKTGDRGEIMPTHWEETRDPAMESVSAVGGHVNPNTGERHPTEKLQGAQFGLYGLYSKMVRHAEVHGESGNVGTGTWKESGKVDVDVASVAPAVTEIHEQGAMHRSVERGEKAVFFNNPAREVYNAHGQYHANVYEDGSDRPAHDPAPRPHGHDVWLAKYQANNPPE